MMVTSDRLRFISVAGLKNMPKFNEGKEIVVHWTKLAWKVVSGECAEKNPVQCLKVHTSETNQKRNGSEVHFAGRLDKIFSEDYEHYAIFR